VSGDALSVESLRQHCRSNGLSRYKYSERLILVDVLPRNQFGKFIKTDLPRGPADMWGRLLGRFVQLFRGLYPYQAGSRSGH